MFFPIAKVRFVRYLGIVVLLAVKDGLCGQIWLRNLKVVTLYVWDPQKIAAEDLTVDIGTMDTYGRGNGGRGDNGRLWLGFLPVETGRGRRWYRQCLRSIR